MATHILWIGHGERANELEWLFELMGKYTLDPTWEKYGNFATNAEPGVVDAYNSDGVPLTRDMVHFFGNFFDYSCSFSIYTNDRDVLDRMYAAIKAQQSSVAYKEARDERKEQERYRAKREREQRKALQQRTRARSAR